MKTYRDFLAMKFEDYLSTCKTIGDIYCTKLSEIALEGEEEYRILQEEFLWEKEQSNHG